FYNKKIFADNNIQLPTTLPQLFAICDTLKAKGITPIALGSKESWAVGEIMWHGLFIADSNPQYYMDFFHGLKSPSDPQVKQAFPALSHLLDYTNADAPTLAWDEAANLVFEGKAAMTFMGDWTRGFFTDKGWATDNQFGAFPTPGTTEVVVYDADAFGLPKGAPNREAAIELLKTFGSVDGQNAVNLPKGTVPARIDG